MRRLFFIMAIIILCVVSCRERTNVFDINSEDFMAPPHIWDTWVSYAYYDIYGQLCGVRMEIDFTDRFGKDLPLYHEFYEGTSLRTEVEFIAEYGTLAYYVEIYGPYQVGDYYLKIFFGEIPIGACAFRVVSDNGVLKIQNTSIITMDLPKPDSWSCSIFN
jgi:hypothetical protein